MYWRALSSLPNRPDHTAHEITGRQRARQAHRRRGRAPEGGHQHQQGPPGAGQGDLGAGGRAGARPLQVRLVGWVGGRVGGGAGRVVSGRRMAAWASRMQLHGSRYHNDSTKRNPQGLQAHAPAAGQPRRQQPHADARVRLPRRREPRGEPQHAPVRRQGAPHQEQAGGQPRPRCRAGGTRVWPFPGAPPHPTL
jgi:hypothetical protein